MTAGSWIRIIIIAASVGVTFVVLFLMTPLRSWALPVATFISAIVLAVTASNSG